MRRHHGRQITDEFLISPKMLNHNLAFAEPTLTPPVHVPKIDASPDALLVTRIRARDTAAEHQLVARFHPAVKKLARQLGADANLSEDLAQETLLKVLINLRAGRLKEASRLAAYINQTARFTYYGWQRNKNNQLELWESCDDARHEFETEQAVVAANEQRWLARQIHKLNMPRDKQLLLRFYFDHQDKCAVCAELDLSPHQFDKLMCRARKRLQKIARD
jgi:RNA polymerase sigma factor (sigma-70 family)